MTQVKKSTERPEEHSPEPVLTLSTAVPVRPTVAIDETPYEMALMADFGIVEQQRLSREGAEFQRLWGRDKLTSAQSTRLKELLDRQFGKVLLELPAEVAGKVNDEDRAAVVLSFMLTPLRKAQQEAAAREGSSRPIADWAAGLLDRELDESEAAELQVALEQAIQNRNLKPGESSTSES